MTTLTDIGNLAVFGGTPLFKQVRTTGQLANRNPERFFALAKQAFERRRLTNQGPLVCELEEQLCQLHGVPHCISFANACFALIVAIRSLARPGARKVLLPSLTFRGLPHLIRWAGLEPQYCDVDAVTHTLSPRNVAQHIGPDTAAILVVDNVNALCDIDALEQIAASANVPLILDCVYAIGGAYARGTVGSRGAASVFSLHATKLINGFEGGYLTTNDDDLARRLRRQRNFGFGDNGIPVELGLNGKLNEIHAALALSNLPCMQDIMADNQQRFESYRALFADLPWLSFADYSNSPGNYGLVLMKPDSSAPYTRDQLVQLLRAENALVRPYYDKPLHRGHPEAAGGIPVDLPVTDRVSQDFVQMPVGDLMSIADIERLRGFFEILDRESGAIIKRLRG